MWKRRGGIRAFIPNRRFSGKYSLSLYRRNDENAQISILFQVDSGWFLGFRRIFDRNIWYIVTTPAGKWFHFFDGICTYYKYKCPRLRNFKQFKRCIFGANDYNKYCWKEQHTSSQSFQTSFYYLPFLLYLNICGGDRRTHLWICFLNVESSLSSLSLSLLF